MRSTATAAVLSLAIPLGAQQGARQPDSAVRTVQDLVAKIEAKQRSYAKLRARLELKPVVPIPGREKPLELTAVAKIAVQRQPGGPALSRLEMSFESPMGRLFVEMVRGPGGVRIHQASEMSGENWFKIDAELAKKLDAVAERFGSTGALQQGGGGRPSALLGADLVRGFARTHRLRLEPDVEVGGVLCHHLAGTRKQGAAGASLPGMPAADEVHLYFDVEHLVLRKMVQNAGGHRLFTLVLRDLDLAPKFEPGEFELRPPAGVRFRDIMEDRIASESVRLALERYRRLQEEEKKRAAGENEAAGKPASAKKR